MPHNRLANFDLLLFTSLKFARRANLPNLEDMIRLQSKWKSFVETTNDELGNMEKMVRSNEAWYKLFDDNDAGIHPEAGSFANNYIRAAGEVKHNGKTYFMYLWSEKIYFCEKVKKNSDKAKKVISCLICRVEFGDLDAYHDKDVVPLVLYSRDEVINGPKKHNNLNLWEPRLFSFQPIESETPFNHGVLWMTNKTQWLFELSRLLEKDREKSSKDKFVRLYFGENRPIFKHRDRTFIAERRSIDLTKNEEQNRDEPEMIGKDDVTAKTSFEGFYEDNLELNTIPAKELIMLTSKFSKKKPFSFPTL
jgi:hypothetical protein